MGTARCAPMRAAGGGGESCKGAVDPALDGQTLAALGAASVDDGTAAAGLHTYEEAVGTGAADFGSLVSAFHDAFS